MQSDYRKLNHVPALFWVGFVVFLSMQLMHHHFFKTGVSETYRPLSQPVSSDFYRISSLGSDKLASYLWLLKIQLHDNQKGRHLNYSRIDYEKLSRWLLTMYELNPQSDYPAFLATRVYSQVKDQAKIRQMIAVTEELFKRNPLQHWRRLTEASLLAKHQLKDLNLALKLANKIATLPTSVKLPFWARDMKLILMDELNQYESAILLISTLLQGNEIKDPDERRFLQQRLLKIQQSLLKIEQIKQK